MSTTKLFVYGTLKRGQGRAPALAGQRFLGEGRTQPRYRLFDCGGFPGLVESDEGLAVEGELWEVDAECLSLLDEIEGVAHNMYERARVELEERCGNEVETYFYRQSTAGLRDCGNCW